MRLVDEHDDLVLVSGDLIHRLGQTLLEITAVAGTGEHGGQVQRDDPAPLELGGNSAVDDRLGDAVDDRGLSDARLADQHGVVLRAAAEDLDRLLDLVASSDHGVEFTGACARGQVDAVLVEHAGAGCRRLCTRGFAADRGVHVLARGVGESIRRHTDLSEHLTRRHVLTEHEREEDVRRLDVGRAGGAGHLVGVEERAARTRRDRGSVSLGTRAGRRQPGLDRVDDLVRRHADALDRLCDRGVFDDRAQNVQRVELGLAAFKCQPAGVLQDLLRARGEEPAEVDRPGLPGSLA